MGQMGNNLVGSETDVLKSTHYVSLKTMTVDKNAYISLIQTDGIAAQKHHTGATSFQASRKALHMTPCLPVAPPNTLKSPSA